MSPPGSRVPEASNPFELMWTKNVSPPFGGGPLSHAFTVKPVVLRTPPSKNGPTASNSAPLLAVPQKLELGRNGPNEVPFSVFPCVSAAENLPCTPVASDVTSNPKVMKPPSGTSTIVPAPLSSTVCGAGGCGHASSLGVSGFRASLHAVATARSATAAADTLRELVRFMGAPLLERLVREPLRQNADPAVACATARGETSGRGAAAAPAAAST